MSRGTFRRRQDPHACLVKGCGAIIPGWQLICTPCFKRLPFEKRQAIAQAGQDKAPHRVSQLCIEAAGWLTEQHGAAAQASAEAMARMLGERND